MILHREINKLKQQLMEISALVEEHMDLAIRSIAERDSNLARIVIDGDATVDEREVALEEECLKVLALHQPVAIDLRVIVAILKINNDLERIGDLAMDIAQRSDYFATHEAVEFPFEFEQMAQETQKMLQSSMDAFVNLDIDMATKVCETDDLVDLMHEQMFQKVQDSITRDPGNIGGYLSSMTLSRCLERIADHSTNIAEDVIYMIEGNVVRHSGEIY